jgi:hypothetical protein
VTSWSSSEGDRFWLLLLYYQGVIRPIFSFIEADRLGVPKAEILCFSAISCRLFLFCSGDGLRLSGHEQEVFQP